MINLGPTTSDLVSLRDLRPGAVFVVLESGTMAVKSEYHYPAPSGSSQETQCECILLESGEYAHFPKGNDTLVKEVAIPSPRWLKGTPRPEPITTGLFQSADTTIRWDSVLIALMIVLVLLGAAGILLYLWA